MLRSNTVGHIKVVDVDHQMLRMADPLLNRYYHTNGPSPSPPTRYPLSHKPLRNEPNESESEAKTVGSVQRTYHAEDSGQSSNPLRTVNGAVVFDQVRKTQAERAEQAPRSSPLGYANVERQVAEGQTQLETNPVLLDDNAPRTKRV